MRVLQSQKSSDQGKWHPERSLFYLGFPIGFLIVSLLLTWVAPPAGMMGAAVALGWTVVVNPCGVAHAGALGPSLLGVKGRALWWRMITAYTLIGLISASAVGALLGFVGLALEMGDRGALNARLLLVVLTGCLLHALFPSLFRLPEIRRQTRARWLTSEVGNAALWGADVGLTFATWISFPGAWALAALAIVFQTPLFGASLFACYWLGRAMPHWVEPVIFPADLRTGTIMQAIVAKDNAMRILHVAGLIVMTYTLWAY